MKPLQPFVFLYILTVFIAINLLYLGASAGDLADMNQETHPPLTSAKPFVFALPDDLEPVVVSAHFELRDINDINDEAETFEFYGVLTLKWQDKRLAFDPSVESIEEKVYIGEYQFNEIAAGWYPQVVLANQAGMFEKSGTVLRIQPDGTSVLVETLNAIVESEFNMTRFPFDKQRLEAVFEVLAFDEHEVQLKVESGSVNSVYGEADTPAAEVGDCQRRFHRWNRRNRVQICGVARLDHSYSKPGTQ